MSYKVLARKWRPQHFRDMLGQEPVRRALVNALDTDRLHHAYLFTGMRGVGKTSIARIFAKCLNCETHGVTSDPCGTCSTCMDIDAGRFFDLIEVDAASRTKVEGTRELLENVPYAPASGRFKVYLIDEVHMFSTHSFNALLKTLEEPPEHVKFLLATTDPQKVPATVLSRCLQFNLKRISPGMLTDYLANLLSQENIEYERPALDLIARASEGSVRDSLSLVEQAAAGGEGAIRASEVESMLGRASVDRLLSLIETLAAGDMPGLFAQVEALAQYAPEFSELLGELVSLLHRIAMIRSVPGSVADTEPGFDRLVALADSLHPDEVQLFYQIGLHARRDMPFAPDTREAFDMALLRMHTFRPQGHAEIAPPAAPRTPQTPTGNEPDASSKNSVSQAIGASGTSNSLSGAPAKPPASSASSTTQSIAAGRSTGTSGRGEEKKDVTPSTTPSQGLPVRGSVSAGGSMRAAALAAARGEPLPDDVAKQVAEITAQNLGKSSAGSAVGDEQARPEDSVATAAHKDQHSAGEVAARTDSIDDAPSPADSPSGDCAAAPVKVVRTIDKSAVTPADWPMLVSELDIAGMPAQLASHCAYLDRQADTVILQLEESSEHLHKPRFVERLQHALGGWFGAEIQVSIELVAQVLETPARITERQAADDLAAAHDSIKLDPIVRQLIDKVDGAVDESSIKPIAR